MVPALLLASSLVLARPASAAPVLPDRWAYDAVWMGAAWEAGSPGGSSGIGAMWDEPVEFDLAIRNVSDGPLFLGSGVEHRVRLSRDENGRTVVDELTLSGRLIGLSIRPAMGDRFDLSLLGGRWTQNVYGLARSWTHLQVFVPLHLVPLGFSDTDADADSTLRYYAAAGAGIGADWLVRVVGAVGLRLRLEGAADTMHRLRSGDERDQVRHEVWARAEADFVLVDDEMPMTIGVWAESRTQWETRDTPEGVDRQVTAGGLRFGLRLFRTSPMLGEGTGQDGNPANERAIEREERRHERSNWRNGRLIDAEPDVPVEEESVPAPATPEQHDANNEAN